MVNYYSEDLILKSIQSIKKSTNENELDNLYEIIVVDNGSNTNILQKNKKDLYKMIENQNNKGFGAACNIGFKYSNSKYVLFLNPDTKVFKNTIIDSIHFMDNNQEVTVLGCQQVNEFGNIIKTCASKITLKAYLNKSLYLNKILPKIFKGYHMLGWNHKDSRYVNHVMGSFYLLRSNDFVKVNGFDEDYFMYYEDLDLSTRIINSGGKIFYNSDIKIYHETGGTSKNFKPHRLFYSLDSAIVFGKKHMSKLEYLSFSTFILIGEPFLRVTYSLIKLDFKELKQTIQAYKMLYSKRAF